MSEESRYVPQERSALERIVGGHPGAVAVRLVLVSLVVGFLMTLFGVDAQDLLRNAIRAVDDVIRNGSGILGDLGRYILTGAAVVIPIWLVLRLTRFR